MYVVVYHVIVQGAGFKYSTLLQQDNSAYTQTNINPNNNVTIDTPFVLPVPDRDLLLDCDFAGEATGLLPEVCVHSETQLLHTFTPSSKPSTSVHKQLQRHDSVEQLSTHVSVAAPAWSMLVEKPVKQLSSQIALLLAATLHRNTVLV
jgi:hypothetical protein